MPRPLLILDLDGTLLDTAPDLLGALNAVLAEEGLPEVEREVLALRFGHGARALILEAYRLSGRIHEAEGGIDRLTDRFLHYYGRRCTLETRPFPGAVEAMDRFAAAGIRFAVCTNKRRHLAEPILESLGLLWRFDAVLGGDSLPVRKPDPGHILGTIAAAGADPATAVMVGDSDADILAARAAGVPVVGVTFGYSPEPVATLGPDAVIDHFDDLDRAAAAVSPAFAAALAAQKVATASS